jgi:hypothetical protein
MVRKTNEEMFLTDPSLFSADLVHKIDPSEVWRVHKG